ncbi:hypothetical protein SAMN04487895_103452 [Paenibacillus sophorae]|uniref:LysR substrate-binding domain-containing protein n=1 Tax=Paenibacillus sophorae TaxID=1333845 RepID=A0A1H8KHM2_9BACL|nr:hypothetical protein [Paenibacillus sophorae]QWU13751.1 hypothetical protein KP014_17420 [Paenibacillus sophorae]SEN92473.1 hypothetical protein SAMN04487895_103452 [Paenibacillus sophorae]
MSLIQGKSSLRLTTLGPEGTSSFCTALHLEQMLKQQNPLFTLHLLLKRTFAEVFDSLLNKEADYALIPDAYEKATRFFWCPHFDNMMHFLYSTPDYGIISRTDFDLSRQDGLLRIAVCPAVEDLLPYFQTEVRWNGESTIVSTSSTTEAAIFVADDIADIAVTNDTSFQLYQHKNLKWISDHLRANIVWSVFGRVESGE